MRRLRLQELIVALMLLLVRVASAQEVGTIAAADGTAEIGRGGTWGGAMIGAVVRVGDELRTGQPGRLRIVFRDSSVINVGDASHLRIEGQAFDVNQGLFRSMLHLFKGKLRPLVSEYYQRPRAVYEIETETAVVGVRGTEFVVAYDPVAEVSDVVGVTGTVEVHSVQDRVGHAVFVTAQNLTTVSRGKFPTAPQRLSDKLFRQYIEGLEFIGNGRPESLTVGNSVLAGSAVSPGDAADALVGSARTPALGVVPVMPGDAPYEIPTAGNVTKQPPLLVRPTGDLGINF